jgi:hypothetical protein
MSANEDLKKTTQVVWPGRAAALRRLLGIALVLFPCTWVVTALLIKNWDLLDDRSAEAFRHLREAGVVFVVAVCTVFLLSVLPSFQRFFGWVFSPRTLRHGLIVAAWLVTIVAVFYGEEDWRGRHAWNKCSDALKARGEVLDFKAFVPQPIPDAENFAATPEIRSWFIENTNAGPRFQNHWDADVFGRAKIKMPSISDRVPSRVMDLVAWQKAFEAERAGQNDSVVISDTNKLDLESRAQAAPAVLEALKPLDPQFEELRQAASRPRSEYPVVYDLENPWGILLPHLVNIDDVCLRLQLRACAELAAGQSDRALEDVKLMLRMSDSLDEESTLISYLVRTSSFHFAVQPIWEGLAEHRWSDAQLKDLQSLLERYNFIADLKRPLDGERSAGILTADLMARGKYRLNDLTRDPGSAGSAAANSFGTMMPHGWYELEKLNYCRLFDLQLKGAFDAQAKRVFPAQIATNVKALDRALAGRNPVTAILTRHQLLAAVLLPSLAKMPQNAALAQVVADEALIACALERYRLARGQFPESLDALAPEFIAKLPADVIGGAAYQYRRTADGQFVLYSVGWNEIDDGGRNATSGNAGDRLKSDWVWQYSAGAVH